MMVLEQKAVTLQSTYQAARNIRFRKAVQTLVPVICGLVLAASASAACAAWDLQQLMQNLSQNKSGQATFVEKKYIAVLDKPVESSGELLYTAPDRLEKRTLKPKPESMIVSGNELVVERGRQKHRVQLQNYPELAAFIDSIRGTLAGDLKALERNYQLSLEGTAERWTQFERKLADPRVAALFGIADETDWKTLAQANIDGFMTLMQAAREAGAPRWKWAPAGCAVRAPASPETRPCGDPDPPAP